MALSEFESLMCGKWKLDRSEHFEDFLKENGVIIAVRKMASMAKPTQDLSVEDQLIKIVLHTGFFDQTNIFKLDENFEMTTQGITYKCMATWEDQKLIMDQQPIDPKKHKAQKLVREILDGELVLTVYIADVICKRIFKRVN